ncbi:hypothetical protein C8J57DRAFT_1727211 [Mycena rebaudengoi]|nr:hypothetical protein C8J57DRAFT_1727211 [Mycena rebaudengoi]
MPTRRLSLLPPTSPPIPHLCRLVLKPSQALKFSKLKILIKLLIKFILKPSRAELSAVWSALLVLSLSSALCRVFRSLVVSRALETTPLALSDHEGCERNIDVPWFYSSAVHGLPIQIARESISPIRSALSSVIPSGQAVDHAAIVTAAIFVCMRASRGEMGRINFS